MPAEDEARISLARMLSASARQRSRPMLPKEKDWKIIPMKGAP
jgi:hypothetical protein